MQELKLEIITYPHPTLRHASKPIVRVDAALRKIVSEMFDLMYAARGVGLAANQVDLPLRLFVVNLTAEKGTGEELVFINPVVSRPKSSEEAEEGCLSIPEVYGPVARPKQIHINAYSLDGQEMTATLDGLLARVIQHESDHLDGVLFPDKMNDSAQATIADDLTALESQFAMRQQASEIPTNDAIAQRLQDWETKYC